MGRGFYFRLKFHNAQSVKLSNVICKVFEVQNVHSAKVSLFLFIRIFKIIRIG